MAAVLLLWLFRDLLGLDGGDRDENPVTTLAAHQPRAGQSPAEPGVVPLVVAGVAVLAMVAVVVAQLRADRRRRRPPRPGPSGWSGCSTTPSRTWSATPTRARR